MEPIVYAKIDLNSIVHNLKEIKKIISNNTKIMAVVKANGYGHGAYEVAKIALSSGASSLAVARLEEAIFLREKGIDSDILIFGPIQPHLIPEVFKYNLTVTLFDIKQATGYQKYCVKYGEKLKCHIKVDTGMGRLGFVLSDRANLQRAKSDIFEIINIKEFFVEGVYTHFACADEEDLSYSFLQLDRFKDLIYELKKKGLAHLIFHAANSAGTVQIPDSHLNMVRIGIMLYGLYPSEYIKKTSNIKLIPAMSLRAKISQIKHVSPGFKVSYGSTYVTTKNTTLATIPVGYADGYPRIVSSKGYVLVNGKLAKIAGRVCMDQMVLDVTGIDVKQGDEVIIFGREKNNELSADEVAKWAETINYEIVSQITGRVKRVYVGGCFHEKY